MATDRMHTTKTTTKDTVPALEVNVKEQSDIEMIIIEGPVIDDILTTVDLQMNTDIEKAVIIITEKRSTVVMGNIN
jgi:vacuolar-type H+-ATPase subunit F/Vma7